MIPRIAPIAAIILVIAGVIAAFAVMGSPDQARLVHLDTIRARNAQAIVATLNENFGGPSNFLPQTIAHIPLGDRFSLMLRDPQTKRLYEYHRIGAHRYKLCIDFSAPTDPGSTEGAVRQWTHTTPGRDCKTLTARR